MELFNIPRRRLYPVLGGLLAAFAPGGLLLLRGSILGQLLSQGFIVEELSSRALTYAYIGVSTAIVFIGLGIVLGSHEDLLKRISLTDALTELPNRRHFERRLRDELARVDRYGHALALMMIDLDRLKGINDQLGHEAGDNAIRAVARTMEKSCRTTDFAARFGGDEFAVLAPNINAKEAQKIAERIRQGLAAEVSWVPAELPPLTLSIGVADTWAIPQNHPDRLLAAADKALYAAKQNGRDRVVLATPVRQPDPASSKPELGGATSDPASQEA